MKKAILIVTALAISWPLASQAKTAAAEIKPRFSINSLLVPSFFDRASFSKNNDPRLNKLEHAFDMHASYKPAGWDKLVDFVKSQPTNYLKLRAAHVVTNQIPYLDGTDGSYFSPIQSVKRGAVVCKDYVVMKMLLLKESGAFRAKDLMFIVHESAPVIGKTGGELMTHVALGVRVDSTLYVSNQPQPSEQRQFLADHRTTAAKMIASIKQKGLFALDIDKPLEYIDTTKSLTTSASYAWRAGSIFWMGNELGSYQPKPKNGKEFLLNSPPQLAESTPQPIAIRLPSPDYIPSLLPKYTQAALIPAPLPFPLQLSLLLPPPALPIMPPLQPDPPMQSVAITADSRPS